MLLLMLVMRTAQGAGSTMCSPPTLVTHQYLTYNANKSFCMVIDNKPRDKKNIHPVVMNNHTLPYTEKYKYLGHIINNNLTDDDDIARQKRCIYAQANALARKFNLCNSSIKTTLFNSYCGSMYTSSLWCN